MGRAPLDACRCIRCGSRGGAGRVEFGHRRGGRRGRAPASPGPAAAAAGAAAIGIHHLLRRRVVGMLADTVCAVRRERWPSAAGTGRSSGVGRPSAGASPWYSGLSPPARAAGAPPAAISRPPGAPQGALAGAVPGGVFAAPGGAPRALATVPSGLAVPSHGPGTRTGQRHAPWPEVERGVVGAAERGNHSAEAARAGAQPLTRGASRVPSSATASTSSCRSCWHITRETPASRTASSCSIA